MVTQTIYLKNFYPFLGEDGRNPKVDLYLPYNLKEMNRQYSKRPSIIICPGGAYSFCSEREAEPVALKFLSEGFNIFIINYSVAPNRFPIQLCEVAALTELIYKNADSWNCDTSKIAIMGYSAGGHLAAHYSNKYDCEQVREKFPNSKPVNASLLCYPVITADPKYAHMGSFDNLTGNKKRTLEETEFFSCEKMVRKTTPPAFIWHTAADNAVPVMNSLLYASALSEFNIPYELHIYPYGDHGLSTADSLSNVALDQKSAHSHQWIEGAKKWLKLMDFKIKT